MPIRWAISARFVARREADCGGHLNHRLFRTMSVTITAAGQNQTRSILIGSAVLLSLGMGLRQSLGLFLSPVTRDLALTAADFTLAIAVQNVVWGVSQAPVGALADRFGLRITMMTGALIYATGLGVLATAGGQLALIV